MIPSQRRDDTRFKELFGERGDPTDLAELCAVSETTIWRQLDPADAAHASDLHRGRRLLFGSVMLDSRKGAAVKQEFDEAYESAVALKEGRRGRPGGLMPSKREAIERAITVCRGLEGTSSESLSESEWREVESLLRELANVATDARSHALSVYRQSQILFGREEHVS